MCFSFPSQIFPSDISKLKVELSVHAIHFCAKLLGHKVATGWGNRVNLYDFQCIQGGDFENLM